MALLLPATAAASTSQESLFQDDTSLLFSTHDRRQETLDELKALGVDTIRSNLLWNWVAPNPNSKTRPAGFDAADPNAYGGLWFRFDELARGAAARGITLQWTITGPIPAWASDCNGSVPLRHTCRPNPREYGQFVKAVGTRYSGLYAGLPRVSRWSLWNEPNQAGWLYPQTKAPSIYRSLAYAGISGLEATGHGDDMILLGETAPLGRRFGPAQRRNMAPLPFWQGVLCVQVKCRGRFKRLEVDGIAHHPYTRGGAGSPTSVVGPGDVTLARIGKLSKLLDKARHLRRVPSRLPIYLTEYGFQTNPPDRLSGVSPTLAATWLNQSDWIAYNNSRIKAVAQYELFDEKPLHSFQTGLRFRNGKAKPGLAAYRLPLWVVFRGGRTTIWGQVRAGERGSKVDVLMQKTRRSGFRRFKTVTIGSSRGFFRLVTRRRAYRWRLSYKPPFTSRRQLSRAAAPAPR